MSHRIGANPTQDSEIGIGISPPVPGGPSPSPVLVAAGTTVMAEYLKAALPDWLDQLETRVTSRRLPLSGSTAWQPAAVVGITSAEDSLQRFLDEAFAGGLVQVIVAVDGTAATGFFNAQALLRDQDGYRQFSTMAFQPQASLDGFRIWLESTLLLSSAHAPG